MEFVSRLTEQELTPLTPDTAFSTLAEQAAQLMPVTVYCSIVFYNTFFLFHKLLQCRNKLVYDLILALADISCDAAPVYGWPAAPC